jgi:hypothetical protein
MAASGQTAKTRRDQNGAALVPTADISDDDAIARLFALLGVHGREIAPPLGLKVRDRV